MPFCASLSHLVRYAVDHGNAGRKINTETGHFLDAVIVEFKLERMNEHLIMSSISYAQARLPDTWEQKAIR
jgi:hypothetical protein